MILANNSQLFKPSLDSAPHLLTIGIEDSSQVNMLHCPHSHDNNMELSLTLGGSAEYIVDGKNYVAGPGDLLVFDARTTHERCHEQDIRVFSLRVTEVRFLGFLQNTLIPKGRSPCITCGEGYEEIYTLFSRIYDNILLNNSLNNELANCYLRALLVRVHQLAQENIFVEGWDNHMIAIRCKEYFDYHYAEPLSLNELADSLNISRYYLTHVFTKAYRISPKQYVIRRRIGRAQTLLWESNMSVTQIALEVGFGNVNHFHNAFKRQVGVTPGFYREKWQR